MKDSEILKKARAEIENGCSFICWAIKRGCLEHDAQKQGLVAWVEHMLDGPGTYGEWLERHHPEWMGAYSMECENIPRLQWLDWMIAYCEAEEAKQ